MAIEDLRREYARHALTEAAAGGDALDQFRRWFDEAVEAEAAEPTAMTLATVGPDGAPRARIVLLKGAEPDGFRFFTNYESDKGRELTAEPRAALTLFWSELERQVRIEGAVERLPEPESDRYFESRPRASQLGAWASPQSRELPGRDALEARLAEVTKRFDGQDEIPRPPSWGGFLVVPRVVEFWQGRPGRLHDRLRYTRAGDGWQRARLAP